MTIKKSNIWIVRINLVRINGDRVYQFICKKKIIFLFKIKIKLSFMLFYTQYRGFEKK
jgi:hypothetical protein